MHKLRTLLSFWVKSKSGVIWGHRGQILIFTKMHYLVSVIKSIHVIHTLAPHLPEDQANWGQSGVKVLKRAVYFVCDFNMSSSFFFLLAKLQRLIASTCFDRFQPDSGHKNP